MLKKLKPSLNILYIVFFAITIIYMLIKPEISINAINDTLILFSNTVLPSLFPFILCTQVLIMLNSARIIGFPFLILTKILGYDANVAGAYAASLVGGYPIGASSLNLLYNQNMLKGNYLAYILLCSNCGPMFVLATVGTIMLGSYKIGLIIFIAHAIGAVIVSVIASTIKVADAKNINNKTINKNKRPSNDIFDIIEAAVINTAKIMAKIFGMLCFFRLISDILFSSLQFSDTNNTAAMEAITRGLIEMVDGCIKASELGGVLSTCIICFIISFGGLSAIFQSISVSKDIPYSRKLFLVGKMLHGIISGAICYILMMFIPVSIATANFTKLTYEAYVYSTIPSYLMVIVVFCVVFMIFRVAFRKLKGHFR